MGVYIRDKQKNIRTTTLGASSPAKPAFVISDLRHTLDSNSKEKFKIIKVIVPIVNDKCGNL